MAAARARGGEFAHRGHRSAVPYALWRRISQVAGGLSLTTSNLAAASRTQPHTRLNCLWVRSIPPAAEHSPVVPAVRLGARPTGIDLQ
jgi:hypothetical protein